MWCHLTHLSIPVQRSGAGIRTEGRDDVSGVERIFVLDEAEAAHELDFDDLTAMFGEVLFYVLTSRCSRSAMVIQLRSHLTGRSEGTLAISREVAEVEAG
jgi:hypothetical protein